jgi:pilus assembly protein CpaC
MCRWTLGCSMILGPATTAVAQQPAYGPQMGYGVPQVQQPAYSQMPQYAAPQAAYAPAPTSAGYPLPPAYSQAPAYPQAAYAQAPNYGMMPTAQAVQPGAVPPVYQPQSNIFNYPAQLPIQSNQGGVAQAGYDDQEMYRPDAVKSRNLPIREENMSPAVRARFETLISEVQEPDIRIDLIERRSKLIRTKSPVVRVSIAEPGIVDTVNFSPNEFELIGRAVGETTVTLWFGDAMPAEGATPLHPVLRYLVKVHPDMSDEDIRRTQYGELAKRLNELFPNSYIQIIAVADKLVVRGQARDAQEAAAIMNVVRGQSIDQAGGLLGPGSSYGWGGGPGWNSRSLARGWNGNDWATDQIISMLEVPGEHQVLLKVRVARLTRGALRTIGSQFSAQAGDFSFTTNLNITGAYQAVLNSTDVQLTLSALSSNRTTKILAEPNLVTLSGYPAYFISGGQFAVPSVLGVNGVAGTVTQFQGYGTQLQFTPTVLDKDHVRLQVAPTVSSVNTQNTVNQVPGLNVESVYTTVDLREGQWLAIAGLIQDSQDSSKVRVPWVGDIPIVDLFFSRRSVARDETELVILVSPEMVHPLEPEQVPMVLPGMEVTEPDDCQFFILGRYEGRPEVHHRSTVWPVYQWSTWDARMQGMWSAKQSLGYGRSTSYYMNGPSGFTN